MTKDGRAGDETLSELARRNLASRGGGAEVALLEIEGEAER